MELQELKKNYDVLAKKYKLPSFSELNEDFEIEKIERESDSLLRIIRKMMMEKIVNSLGFVEMLLTTMNAPRMYLTFIKSMTSEDKKRLENMYDLLTGLSMESLGREIEYSEKKEAELIVKTSKTWNSIKPDFKMIIEEINHPKNYQVKKERSYFG
ncbi:MAG: hypothetical protein Q7S74_06755 [Nanoarchaeota archaeon]|nr:hypothetical protein [Nanoarchaeota archaeon]